MTSPVNLNVKLKGVEKLFDIIKSYFGMRMIRATAQQKADAHVLEARSKREARLLAAQTKVDVELIEERGEIDKKKLQAEGKHELAMLKKQLKAKELPPPEDEIIINIDDFFVESTPAEIVVQGGQTNPYEYVEQRRFRNTKRVLSETIKVLPEHAETSEEPVEPDWYARFFDNVKDVSHEDMQKLWGRLLAGEIAKPGRYSLRTLDVLRNMAPVEARIFERYRRFSTSTHRVYIPNHQKIQRDYGILDTALLRLIECGLLHQPEEFVYGGLGRKVDETVLFGTRCMRLTSNDNKDVHPGMVRLFGGESYKYTRAGTELSTIMPYEPDESYFVAIGDYVRNNFNIDVEIVDNPLFQAAPRSDSPEPDK
ncbi:MAG: DUF2806 domain-containing protein [Minicystis sp.]